MCAGASGSCGVRLAHLVGRRPQPWERWSLVLRTVFYLEPIRHVLIVDFKEQRLPLLPHSFPPVGNLQRPRGHTQPSGQAPSSLAPSFLLFTKSGYRDLPESLAECRGGGF